MELIGRIRRLRRVSRPRERFFGRGLCSFLFPTERSTEEETPIARAVSRSCAFELSPVGLCVCVCLCVNYLKTNLRSLLITDFCNEFWVYRVLICKEVLPFGSR